MDLARLPRFDAGWSSHHAEPQSSGAAFSQKANVRSRISGECAAKTGDD